MMTYQISSDAQVELQMRAQAALAAELRAEGLIAADDALQVWQDSQEAFVEGHRNEHDFYDRYLTCEAAAAEAIERETAADAPFGDDGSRAATWQGRDGWYWTIVSPDGIEHDDDHGPYECREDALEAIAEQEQFAAEQPALDAEYAAYQHALDGAQ